MADTGMVVAGVAAAGLIIWRDRTSTRRTLAEGLLLALMIAWSGHDSVVIPLAVVLIAVTVVQSISSRARPMRVGRPSRAGGVPMPS